MNIDWEVQAAEIAARMRNPNNLSYEPPHGLDPTNLASLLKVWSIVEAIKDGQYIPYIYVERDGMQAFSGSHRLIAWAIVGVEPNVIELSPAEISDACTIAEIDEPDEDYSSFEEAAKIIRV